MTTPRPTSTKPEQPAPPSRRRKPRKLTREPSVSANRPSTTPTTAGATAAPLPDVKTEISALRQRVNEIESLVQALLAQRRDEEAGTTTGAGGEAPKKAARRRQRRRKKVGEEETEQEELERLREDLAVAGEELATLKGSGGEERGGGGGGRGKVDEGRRARRTRSVSRSGRRVEREENEEVEEVVRDSVPGDGGARGRPGSTRAVTFSGSYRIPLPANVSERDVRAVQKGLSSVQNIARSYIQQSREEHERPAAMNDVQPTRFGSGWSSWFGGYTIGVARFVNNIEVDPPLGATTVDGARPGLRSTRANSVPPARRRPPKLRVAGQRVAGERDKDSEVLGERQIRGLLA